MTRFLASVPSPQRRLAALLAIPVAMAILICAWPTVAQAQFTGNTSNDVNAQTTTDISQINNTPVDSRDATTTATDKGNTSTPTPTSTNTNTTRTTSSRDPQPEPRLVSPRERYKPGEFETYVQNLPNALTIRRFGENLVTDDVNSNSATQDPLPTVPGDYIVRPGDEIALTIWGTVDVNLQLVVDRSGRISIPKIGAVSVAGLRSADLADAISHRVNQTYKNYQLTATIGQVRAIRVFVSGYVQHPGSVTVNGLSSVLHAIMRAGGPSASGSFRDIHLRRGGKEEAVFDLYDLLLRGDRDTDRLVQPDDVIFVGPVGTQVAVLGSVNQQAIYELKTGETIADALKLAGGFTAVADRSRLTIERLAARDNGRVSELSLPTHAADPLATGDVLRVFSVVAAALPQGKQNEHVRIEGEVAHPGDYILMPGMRVDDAIRAAGGLTDSAYPFGTDFKRESVRRTQQVNYERALRDLETDISKNTANQRVTSAEELATQSATAQSSTRLLERLRQIRPTGRIVLQLSPDATSLPNLALEDGDTISIPVRNSSVGVFGSVFNAGSFVFEPGHSTEQYLALAGGPTRGADKGSVFLLRANGSVVSAQQGASFWHSGNNFSATTVQPGDTIFVPEELGKTTFVQNAKDWTQILYQFGLGLAGLNALGL